MTSTMIRLGLILMTAFSPLLALESVAFIVGPNSIKYGAMGEVKPGVRDVTVTAEGDWWIADPGAKCTAKDNSDLQISQPIPQDPRCPKDKMPKAVKFEITATHSNHIMRLQIDGKLHYCDGNGGQPPPFASHIFHADLDVDSDNTNTNTSTYAGRAPDSPADSSAPDPKEDAIEDDIGKPGVVVLVNRGWDQTTAPGIDFDALVAAQKTQDVDRLDTTMVKLADPHLVKTRVVIKGMKDKGTLTLKAPAQVRIYGDDGKLFTTGEKANGEHWFYLEGVTASAALGDAQIAMEVTAPDAIGSSKDTIRCTVVDVAVDGLAEPAKGNTWGTASKRFAYEGKGKVPGVLTVMTRMTLKPALPIALATQLLGESNCTLSVAAIDDSHGAAAGQRVALTWKKDRAATESGIQWTDKTNYTVATGVVSVFARFTGLPLNNSDFGDKWLQVSVMGVPYQKLPWRAFFNPKIDSHPFTAGDSANAIESENWYYYWAQQRKGTTESVCSYAYDGKDPLVQQENVQTLGGHDNGKILFGTLIKREVGKSFNATSEFNNGRAMTWLEGGKTHSVKLGWVSKGAPDLVNITFSHELTYFILQKKSQGLKDFDRDAILDIWEMQLGMNPESQNSFVAFTGSRGSGASRDEEFYCWAIGAFSGPTTNRVATHTFKNVPVPMTHTGAEVPVDGIDARDWSAGGENWVNNK